jgi:hypothetical protein
MNRSDRVKRKMKTLASPERLNRHSVARVAAEGRVFVALPKPLTQRRTVRGMTRMKYTTG